MLAWIDVETTGIDPKSDQILEVGLVFTDHDLDIVSKVSVIVKPMRRIAMWPNVAAMHARSGLLAALDSPEAQDIRVCEDHLRSAVPKGAGKMRLCGYNVSFDRSFLYEHMPALLGDFHYRSIDVASFMWGRRVWTKGDHIEPPSSIEIPEAKHRVIDDCLWAIERAAEMRTIFKAEAVRLSLADTGAG